MAPMGKYSPLDKRLVFVKFSVFGTQHHFKCVKPSTIREAVGQTENGTDGHLETDRRTEGWVEQKVNKQFVKRTVRQMMHDGTDRRMGRTTGP